MREETLIHM